MAETRLQDHVGYWLRRLSDAVHGRFERQLAVHGVTVAQWNALVAVYHGEATTVRALARFIHIDPAAVSRVIDRLEEKGLMARMADPTSRRRVRLALTAAGRALVPALIRVADRNEEAFFGGLGTAERRQLLERLRSLLPKQSMERERMDDDD